MEVRTCRNCRRMFNYISGHDICPACKDELEKKYQVTKEYIRENPKCSIGQVAEACGVTVNNIKTWVREERLQFAEGSSVALECIGCGKTIYTGRYCDDCKKRTASGFTDLMEKNRPKVDDDFKPKKGGKDSMRFI